MRQLIGNYTLGIERIDLFVDPDQDGATFVLCPEPGKGLPWICCGYNYGAGANEKLGTWHVVLAGLLHEALEFCFARLGCRFTDTAQESLSSSRFVFMLGHEQFEEAITRTGNFISECEAALKRHFIKHTKAENKKEQEK